MCILTKLKLLVHCMWHSAERFAPRYFIEICGSSIGGVLSVTECTGNINIQSDTNIANCDPNTVVGGVIIQLGTSAITIRGANIQNGDIGILQNTGAIVRDQLQVSDLNLEKNMGTLNITGVNTDSDSTIIEHTGDILLTNVAFIGDAIIRCGRICSASRQRYKLGRCFHHSCD